MFQCKCKCKAKFISHVETFSVSCTGRWACFYFLIQKKKKINKIGGKKSALYLD